MAATFTHVYRIKDKISETYWNGKAFGTIGKIYVNPKLATKALDQGQLLDFKNDPLVPKLNLVVVESSIRDEAEINL